MSGRWHGAGIAVALSVAHATVTACGALSERRDGVTTEVTRFEQALDAGQHARLCAALAPATGEELEQSAKSRCEEAIGEQELSAAGAV
ncbi:hypothetical protein ABZS96_32390 [Streptomyces avermitilis]|uniref:hypothetical protein n=1 Tax=Streptomyces avermitilis TaxID=33903 RepID=UPI00339F3B4D